MSMDREPEERLWRTAEHLDDVEVTPIDDADLLAYRAGELDETARERVEWALGRNAATRARLIELSGLDKRADEGVRARLLGRARPRRWWPLAAAAILVLGIAIPLNLDRSSDVLENVAFDVRVEDGGEVRSGPDGDGLARAQLGSWLRILVEPDRTLNDDVGFALYRREGERIVRLTETSDVELRARRGAAEFRVRAGALSAERAGTHEFWIVVSGRDALPASLRAVGDVPSTLAQATSGKVYTRSVRVEGERR